LPLHFVVVWEHFSGSGKLGEFYFPKFVSTRVTAFVNEVDRCIAMKVFVYLM